MPKLSGVSKVFYLVEAPEPRELLEILKFRKQMHKPLIT